MTKTQLITLTAAILNAGDLACGLGQCGAEFYVARARELYAAELKAAAAATGHAAGFPEHLAELEAIRGD